MKNNRINYIELPAEDMQSAKDFYGKVFGWQFEDYGPDYCAFNDGNMEGGFYHSPLQSNSSLGAALVVLFSDDLERQQQIVVDHGGDICKPIFSFPGGRRFHFKDLNKNELAVWSDR